MTTTPADERRESAAAHLLIANKMLALLETLQQLAERLTAVVDRAAEREAAALPVPPGPAPSRSRGYMHEWQALYDEMERALRQRLKETLTFEPRELPDLLRFLLRTSGRMLWERLATRSSRATPPSAFDRGRLLEAAATFDARAIKWGGLKYMRAQRAAEIAAVLQRPAPDAVAPAPVSAPTPEAAPTVPHQEVAWPFPALPEVTAAPLPEAG